ncbi:MAG: hypothetical protein QOE39_3029 [Bradyrhizobium sp.]|nr:hypothetical protein [Bradyrhizobium sp.]
MISVADIDIGSYPALGGRSLRNRVMHASMTTELAEARRVTDALMQYHVNRALGGQP